MQRSRKTKSKPKKASLPPSDLSKEDDAICWDKDEIIQLLEAFTQECLRRKVINIYSAFCKQNVNFMKEVAQVVATGKKCTPKITPYLVRKHSTLRFEALALDQKLYWIKRTLKTIEIEES